MDKIADSLGVEGIPLDDLPTGGPGNDNITDDSEFARENLKQLIATSQLALKHALNMAKQSDSPRAYEVLATLLNTTSDLNTKLIDIHSREQKLTTKTPETEQLPPTQQITNNSVIFHGTTTELNNLITKRLNNEIIPN